MKPHALSLALAIATLFFLPVRPRAHAQAPGFTRAGNAQEETDVKAGFNLGRSIGLKRKAEGFPQPPMDYLDTILRAACPGESQAYKVGFKAGYLAAFQRVVPDAL